MAGLNNWREGLSWPDRVKAEGAIEYLWEDEAGVTQSEFDDARALAVLLLDEAVFLNSHWWEKSWPEAAQQTASLNVNCNDVFAWGCADAVEATHDDIEAVYRLWVKDPSWGAAIWCIIKRKELPQKPVADRIRKGGVWDLDALTVEHGLRANHYDGVSHILADRKYQTYCAWERGNGKEPRPFDSAWWAGWKEYEAAHPGWYDASWKAEDKRRLDEFRAANGFADAEAA
jgi:hypothetical protein